MDENIQVIVRFPAADIDMLVILLAKIRSQPLVFHDCKGGMGRKGMYLRDIEIDTDQKKCLVGSSAFTGNDYIWSFFKREKYKVGELLKRMENSLLLSCSWD